MYHWRTMRTPIAVMVTMVTAITHALGVNITVTNPHSSPLLKTAKIVTRTIMHPRQTEVTSTGNDVSLQGETELDFRLPVAKYSISWNKDNKKIAYLATSRIHFENQGMHLRINDVRVSDAGVYQFVIIYLTFEDQKRVAIREITDVELTVHDDGNMCSDVEVACNGYCIPKDQKCSNKTTSLGLIIGAVVGGIIVLLTCVLLFLLSRRGRTFCKRRHGLQESGLCEAAMTGSDNDIPCTSRRNGAVVSFAAKPIVQIYEREDEYTSDSGGCCSDGDKESSPSCEQNGTLPCKTTTV